jgi:hypothetical protein
MGNMTEEKGMPSPKAFAANPCPSVNVGQRVLRQAKFPAIV